jgi:hypothetical protein
MSIFKPYQVIEERKYYLHLSETPLRKIYLFIFFRIYPIIMMVALLLILLILDLPSKYKWLLGSLNLVFIWLFLKSYIVDIVITTEAIEVKKHSLNGLKIQHTFLKDVEYIFVETYLINTGGGIRYHLVLKESRKKLPLLVIPYWHMNLENRKKINQYLTDLTGLKVSNWSFSISK